jgi:hypothetical protein
VRQVADESRPESAAGMARDTGANTTVSTRPSTANTTSTTATATGTGGVDSSTNDAPKPALVLQTPTYPPPPPHQQRHHQETEQPLPLSPSVPRSLWPLRRSRSSARSLALASTKEYVHAKLRRGGGLPSPPTPGKTLSPAPQQQQQQQQQQRKKPIDIHDPEWLASHGLKWGAGGLGLVSTAV